MKKLTLISVAVAGVLMAGCGEQKAEKQAEKAAFTLNKENAAQVQSYAIGAQMGQYLARNMEQQNKLGLNFDKEAVLKGIHDSLEGKAQMEEAEIREQITALETAVRQKQQEESERVAQENQAEGKNFMAENAKVDGVVTTDSGLQYQILTTGKGDNPKSSDTVKVHYRGTLLNGEEFDSSYKRGEPIDFRLDRVIKGWTEGVQLMNVGSKFKFVIPSDLAYGPRGSGPIPPHSTLIFEVELLGIEKADEKADS